MGVAGIVGSNAVGVGVAVIAVGVADVLPHAAASIANRNSEAGDPLHVNPLCNRFGPAASLGGPDPEIWAP
jgi:hypothetical protein